MHKYVLCVLSILLLMSPLTYGEVPAALLAIDERDMEAFTSLDEVTIVVPEGETFLSLGDEISNALQKRFGIKAQVTIVEGKKVASRDDALWNGNLILLGHFGNNPLIATLYGQRLSYVDGYYPGRDGYSIATISDPLGKGKDAIVIGASDGKGLTSGVGEFINIINGLKEPQLPWTLKCKVSPALAGHFKHGLTPNIKEHAAVNEAANITNKLKGSTLTFASLHSALNGAASHGEAYMLTGSPIYGIMYRESLLAASEYILNNPGAVYTALHDGTNMWNWGQRFISIWNFCEASPLFSDKDRKIIVNMLYRLYASNYTDNYLVKMPERAARFNHETIPGVSLYFAANYFDKYYDLPPIEYWLERANKTFQNNTSYISLDEGADYVFHVPCTEIEYQMAGGDIDFFEKGLRDVADLFVMFIDNLGTMASAGDTYPYGHSSAFSWGHSNLMYFASWYLDDPVYMGLMEKVKTCSITQEKPDLNSMLHRYYLDIPAELPEDYPGIKVFSMDQGLYDELMNPDSRRYMGDSHVPVERTFHKMAMRRGLSSDAEYLLLDGFSGGAHGHWSGNAIITYTDKERQWLFDRDYIAYGPMYHNMVVTIKDGIQLPPPPFADMEEAHDLLTSGFTASTLRDYNGVDWIRNILWKKGNFFVVIDQMDIGEDGEYRLDTLWHVMGKANLDERTFHVEQDGGKHFFIANADESAITLTTRQQYAEKYWSSYPYAEPLVTVMKESHRGTYKEGQVLYSLNLLMARDGKKADPPSLKRISPGAIMAEVDGERYLVGAEKETLEGLGISTDAHLYIIDDNTLSLTRVTRLQGRGLKVESQGPISLEIDMASGRLSIESDVSRELYLNGRIITTDSGLSNFKVDGLDKSGINQALEELWVHGKLPNIQEKEALNRVQEKWSVDIGTGITAATEFTLSNGEDVFVLGTEDGQVMVYSHSGKEVWAYPAKKGFFALLPGGSKGSGIGLINDLSVGDIDGDNRMEILIATKDWKVLALDEDGKRLWLTGLPNSPEYAERKGSHVGATKVRVAEGLNGREVVVGTQFRYIHRLNAKDGKIFWSYPLRYYGINDIAVADITGNGRDEIVCGTEYTSSFVVEDNRISSVPGSGPGWPVVSIAHREEGKPLILAGSAKNKLYCVSYPERISHWDANVGGEPSVIETVDIDGDGMVEVLIGTQSGLLWAISLDGDGLWYRGFDDGVTSLLVKREHILVGTTNGSVTWLDLQGRELGAMNFGSPVVKLLSTDDALVVVLRDGRIICITGPSI